MQIISHQAFGIVLYAGVIMGFALGVTPGIILGKNRCAPSIILWLGWIFILWFIIHLVRRLFNRSTNDSQVPILDLIALLCWPFALIGYGLCASLIIQSGGSIWDGLIGVLIGAMVTALVAEMLAMTMLVSGEIRQAQTNSPKVKQIFATIIRYIAAGMLNFWGVVLANVLASAIIGWLLADLVYYWL